MTTLNLETIREAKDYFSSRASDITRQLAFAGIAVVWIFKYDTGSDYKIPAELVLPVSLFVAGLAADFLHYIVAAIVWSAYHRYKEKQGLKPSDEFSAPEIINYPGNIFFFAKIAFVGVGYYYLMKYLLALFGI